MEDKIKFIGNDWFPYTIEEYLVVIKKKKVKENVCPTEELFEDICKRIKKLESKEENQSKPDMTDLPNKCIDNDEFEEKIGVIV